MFRSLPFIFYGSFERPVVCRVRPVLITGNSLPLATMTNLLFQGVPSFAGGCRPFSSTRVLLSYGFNSNRRVGQAAPAKSFAQKLDRTRKSKEERRQSEDRLEEANAYVTSEFPEMLEDELNKLRTHCARKLLELKNVPAALESLEIEVQGHTRKLSQCGCFQRTGPGEMLFAPQLPGITNTVLLQLTKFSHELLPSRADEGKVKFRIPKLTRARRELVSSDLAYQEGQYAIRLRQVRTNALRELKNIYPDMTSENEHALHELLETALKDKESELKSMIREYRDDALSAQSFDADE